MSNINFWMCTSDSRINLDVAYQKGGIWGAKSGKSYDKWWREISKGDLALFYLPKPVSGLVGIGEIVEKPSKTDLRPIWPDESHGRKKYPNRLCFEILHPKVNQPDWEQHKIPIHDVSGIRGNLGFGLKPVRDNRMKSELIERIRDSWI